jgi:hypothetical protein
VALIGAPRLRTVEQFDDVVEARLGPEAPDLVLQVRT